MAFIPSGGFPRGHNRALTNKIKNLKQQSTNHQTLSDFSKTENSSIANAETETTSKRTGGRIGGRVKISIKKREQEPKFPIPLALRDHRIQKSQKLSVTPGDFGFDINGSSSPNVYTGHLDSTLFRDYNKRSLLRQEDDFPLNSNELTNSIKLLNIGLNQSLQGGYSNAFSVIENIITREVVQNTKAAKGALDALGGLRDYFDCVSRAFDNLIELEVLQAWDPDSNDYYDSSLRKLASLAATPEILEYRTQLRQALIPHVLPHQWMVYIKWIRETKLQNEIPESTKLRFNSKIGVSLINNLFRGEAITEWAAGVTQSITALNALPLILPAILVNNVESIKMSNVKEHYTAVHNSATFDQHFNDVYNNRTIYWKTDAGVDNQYPLIYLGRDAYTAFHTDTPYSLSLASVNKHYVNGRARSGLPLEGYTYTLTVDDQAIEHSQFAISYNPNTSQWRIRGIEGWFEVPDDSTHIVDLKSDGSINTYWSKPKGVNALEYVAAQSNIEMAARESISHMTLNDY